MTGAVARRPRPLPCRARKDPQDGGRDGRAGDAPPDRASIAAEAWTRAVTSARRDRPHQGDGAGRLYEEAVAVLDRECGGEDRRGIAPTPGGGDG